MAVDPITAWAKVFQGVTKVVNTGLTLVGDKTRDGGDSVIKEVDRDSDAKGIFKISSKRVLNITGSGGAIIYGMGYLTKASTEQDKWVGLFLILGGMFYSLSMTYITYLTEKAKKV